jgi:hypothetical protein
MTLRTIDETGVRKRLKAACERVGGPAVFARQHSLPQDYVIGVIKGTWHPGPMVVASLGLMRVTRYARRPLSKSSSSAGRRSAQHGA